MHFRRWSIRMRLKQTGANEIWNLRSYKLNSIKLKASYYRFGKVPEGFYAQQRDYDVQGKETFEWAHWVWNVTNSTDRAYCSLVHSLIILEPNFLKSYFYYLFCERVWNMEPKPGGESLPLRAEENCQEAYLWYFSTNLWCVYLQPPVSNNCAV